MSPGWLLFVYCVAVTFASLLGGWLPNFLRLTHTRMQLMMSGVGGLMLGVGLFHLIPHGFAELGSIDAAVGWTMAGLLVTFFLIRVFHFHTHAPTEAQVAPAAGDPLAIASACGHDHSHEHGQDHGHHHGHEHGTPHKLSWLGVFFGLSLHTLIDGMALAAAVIADAAHGSDMPIFGLGTFLAVALHKPLDSLSITSLMAASGWSAGKRNLVNFLYGAMAPLGAAALYFGVAQSSLDQSVIVGAALAFSGGVFLCLSLGDLLPEVQFHSHHPLRLSVALLIGVALAYGIGYLEPAGAHDAHTHDHGHNHSYDHGHAH